MDNMVNAALGSLTQVQTSNGDASLVLLYICCFLTVKDAMKLAVANSTHSSSQPAAHHKLSLKTEGSYVTAAFIVVV